MEGINDKVDRKTMGKVLQIAADSVALSSLQSVLLLSQGNKKTAGCKTVRRLRGRQTAIGGTFKITEKELKIMPEKYRNLFACQDRLVPYRFHKGVFEAHYRRHGLNVFACAKDFETMRRKFIEKLVNCVSVQLESQPLSEAAPKSVLFMDYVKEWLEVKKQVVKPLTYKEYERMAKYHFENTFANHTVEQMTRPLIQKYLFSIVDEGKFRTAEKVHLAFTCIFDLIEEDMHIPSPMKKIVLPYHESKKGSAFTKDEERALVKYCVEHRNNEASSAILVLLYFGLRRSELQSIEIADEMLTCTTSKTKRGRNEVKRTIPFTPMFKKVLPYVDFDRARGVNLNTIHTTIKRLFPAHHTHELRYTFITRAKESGCNPEVVMIWAGHSFDKDVKTSAVDRGYTDYSKEYVLKEAEKLNYSL